MKNYFFLFILLCSFLFCASCAKNTQDDAKFFDTYKEILIIRNQDSDTATANAAVRELLKKRDYTEQSFKDEFIRLSQDPNKFARKIDSIRSMVTE